MIVLPASDTLVLRAETQYSVFNHHMRLRKSVASSYCQLEFMSGRSKQKYSIFGILNVLKLNCIGGPSMPCSTEDGDYRWQVW